MSNLTAGSTYSVAVFSDNGASTAIAYNHSAPVATFTSAGTAPVLGTVFSDSFSSSFNYVANGIEGTMWDGIYLGAGEFNNVAVQFEPSTTLTAQSGGGERRDYFRGTFGKAQATGRLYLLFKNVTGDFSCIAQIVTPFAATPYNTAGLQVRSAGPFGNPSGTGGENFLSLTRFDEYGFANYVRNEVDGGLSQINPNGGAANYWLRVDRVGGTTFNLFETDKPSDPWSSDFNTLSRPDFAGLALQVGLIQCTFAPGAGSVNFANFSLHATNMGPFASAPASPSGVLLSTNSATDLLASWTPASGAAGSLVVVWTSTNTVKEAPSDGFVYSANPGFELGSTLPGATYSVVYRGTGSNVVITNIAVGERRPMWAFFPTTVPALRRCIIIRPRLAASSSRRDR